MKHTKGTNTEALILETAKELFMERGYETTSMQTIAEFCNLTKGGLYHHFASKEEILERICSKHYEMVREATREIVEADLSPIEKARCLIIRGRECEYQNSSYFGVYIRLMAARGNEQLKARIKEYRIMLYLDTLAHVLEEGKKSGDLIFDTTPEIITLFLYQMEEVAIERVGRYTLEPSPESGKRMIEVMEGLIYGVSRLVGIDYSTAAYVIDLQKAIDNYKEILEKH